MKTLEKLVKSLILPITESQPDALQFAYRAGRGVEDAKLFILDKVYTHLEKPTAHANILFANFSLAFNLMQPHILAHKLISDFNLGNQLVAGIVDFLSCRSQSVFVNRTFSDMRLTHTGSPQGCCLSPLLYILYTDSCRSAQVDRFLVTFADDSALLSLLFGSQQDHGPALRDFVEWCDDSYLKFNVSKTKELVIDFVEWCDDSYLKFTVRKTKELVIDFVEWCDDSYLKFNVRKTKELVIDFVEWCDDSYLKFKVCKTKELVIDFVEWCDDSYLKFNVRKTKELVIYFVEWCDDSYLKYVRPRS